MKKSMLITLLILATFISGTAYGAPRVVMYEHFTEDACLYCAEVAEAILAFRTDYSREQAGVISFSIRGDDPVNFGTDRLDFFGLDTVPVVVGDGLDNLGPMPIDESVLISHYNARSSTSSPLKMEVFRDSDTQYTIHLEAESSFSGFLMAVAYEDIYHLEHHYPVYARQILTEYYGDELNMNAGEVQDIIKYVSLEGDWNAGSMGVVAWVSSGSKGDRSFRAHESLQAADSQAAHTNPTATPVENTPTPTPSEGTPTATPSLTQITQDLELSRELFHPNDQFRLDVHTINSNAVSVTVDQYLVLQVANLFFFWPSWSENLDYQSRTFEPLYDGEENIFDFNWPAGVGSYSGLFFWLVSLNPDTSELACPYDFHEFGYTE
jgi:hypothetical protein